MGAGRLTTTAFGSPGGRALGRSLRDHLGELPAAALPRIDHAAMYTNPMPSTGLGDWLSRVRAGTVWHRAEQQRLDLIPGGASEVHVAKQLRQNRHGDWIRPDGHLRLDHYNDDLRHIRSMKHTQLADIKIETVYRYLDEIPRKYPPGTPISDVPSTPTRLIGKELQGQMILHVPPQHQPIPPAILDYAEQLKIQIEIGAPLR